MNDDAGTTTTTAPLRKPTSRVRRFRRYIIFAVGPGLFVLAAVCHVWLSKVDSLPSFLNLLELLLKDGVPIALVAIGAALVLSTAGVDLSVGGVITAAGVVFALATQAGCGVWLATGIACLLGAATGTFLGWCAYEGISPLIASWSTGVILIMLCLSFAAYASEEEIQVGDAIIAGTVQGFNLGTTAADRLWSLRGSAVRLSLALLTSFVILLQLLNLPRRACAVGANIDSARYVGLPVRRILLMAYVTAGVLSASAGTVLARIENYAATTQFVGIELTGIAIAVLGGTMMSGGYLNVSSVICAAFFWVTTEDILCREEIPFFAEGDQTRAASAIFALVLLVSLIAMRKYLRLPTQSILVEGKTCSPRENMP